MASGSELHQRIGAEHPGASRRLACRPADAKGRLPPANRAIMLGESPSAAQSVTVHAYEAAFALGLSERAVVNLVRRGELADVGPGRRLRLDPDQLERFAADAPLALALIARITDGSFAVTRRPRASAPSLLERCRALSVRGHGWP